MPGGVRPTCSGYGSPSLFCQGSSLCGAVFLQGASLQLTATVSPVAARALLALVVNTMIPEATEVEQKITGVVIGLLVAFALSTLGG